MPQRLSYEDSCRALQSRQLLDEGEIPPLPEQSPTVDDEILGVSFFRTRVDDAVVENMTLPRTFFGRSLIRNTSFQNTELAESTANWNDFENVDFSLAELSQIDFRASTFKNVRFTGAQLVGADFRHCTFNNCDFRDADLTDAKMVRGSESWIHLSAEQQNGIDWQSHPGGEPDGG